MKIGWRSLLLAVFVSAMASNIGAQALYGSLLGNVTDETGAALPGATVTITQRETNLDAGRRHQRDRQLQRARTCCRAPIRSTSSLPDFRPTPRATSPSARGSTCAWTRNLKRRRARRVDRRVGAGGRAADRERRRAVADDRRRSSRRCPPAAARTRRRSR